MNIDELESIISEYIITKPKHKGERAENKSFPFMLTTFRGLIKNGVPPTQEEFVKTFKNKYPTLKIKGIISRLKRAYLSYVREYHLGFLLENNFKRVVYSERLDLLGIDYIIYYKKLKFNIHAYVDTENGRYWREIKNERHCFRGHHLDLPMDLTNGKHVGKFILYTDNDIIKLKGQMDLVLQIENKSSQIENI